MPITPQRPARIRLHEPVVDGQRVRFSWESEGDHGLYLRKEFFLDFPGSVNVAAVPEGLWLRVMILCLHSHWLIVRPCRVEIPRTLPQGEREFWLRMIDAAAWTLEFDLAEPRSAERSAKTRRAVELVDYGPPAGELSANDPSDTVVCSFSGGRDSLAQAGMLVEFGLKPLLVTAVSRREASIEFETERFRQTLERASAETGAESIVVNSDFRTCCENLHPLTTPYRAAVSELTDTLLYFSACWAVASARGASEIFLAGEAEAQESLRAEGGVVQIEHFSYSAVTQLALTALAAPTGVANSSLISALEHFQIHRLLASRYPKLRALQYSCYSQHAGEEVCSRCYSCFKTAMYLLSEGVSPTEVEIDVDKALIARSDWEPLGPRSSHSTGTAAKRYAARLDNQLVRVLRELDESKIEALLPSGKLSRGGSAGLARLRQTAFDANDPTPEPGFRADFLALHDEPMRSRLEGVFGEHFARDERAEFAEMFDNTRLLGDWIAAPLSARR